MNNEGMGVVGIIGAALLAVAYFMYPETFHQFFQWLQEGFFDAVENSFTGDGINPDKEKGSRGGQ